jgi:hypothetical protein
MERNDTNSSDTADAELTPDRLYEEMEVLEPYTAGELASQLKRPKQLVRTLLEQLREKDQVRKKEPEPQRSIWIRDAPINECPDCGYRYEVKFLHPVFSSVRFWPRCGNEL